MHARSRRSADRGGTSCARGKVRGGGGCSGHLFFLLFVRLRLYQIFNNFFVTMMRFVAFFFSDRKKLPDSQKKKKKKFYGKKNTRAKKRYTYE